MPKWVPNLCRPSLLLTYCNRGCGKKGASKYHTPVFFFFFLFFCFFLSLFVCFVRFLLFAHFVTHSERERVCVLLSSPARHLREVLSFRRGEDFGASDLASLFFFSFLFHFSFFIFFFWGFVLFFKVCFLVEESSGGICVLGSVRRTWGVLLFVLYAVVVLDPVEIGGNGFRSREAVHRWNIMGDDGGETAGLFQSLRGSDGNGDHEGQSDRTGARFWICHFCGSGCG